MESLSIGVEPVLESGVIYQISSRDRKCKLLFSHRKKSKERDRGSASSSLSRNFAFFLEGRAQKD